MVIGETTDNVLRLRVTCVTYGILRIIPARVYQILRRGPKNNRKQDMNQFVGARTRHPKIVKQSSCLFKILNQIALYTDGALF